MTLGILIAGIGNIFLGDDGFGVEVAQRLAQRPQSEGICVADFGIRGLDLAYALLDEHEAVIFVDIAQRGQPPGTLSVIVPEIGTDEAVSMEAHGMDPVKVLALARSMGAPPTHIFIVACEPERVLSGDTDEDLVGELSDPVRAALDGAVEMVESLVAKIRSGRGQKENNDDVWEENNADINGNRGVLDIQAVA